MSYLFNNEVRLEKASVDGFNRIKISESYTLFDSQHRYQENDKWDTQLTAGGTKTYSENESVVNLIVDGNTNSKVVRQTKVVFPYQPGKSLLTMSSFVFAPKIVGLQQRIGYFNSQNGIFLEQVDNTINVVLRNYVTGAVQETRVAQSSWNGDKFDGTGPSGRTVDLSKSNILWIDMEWLGVGDVRVGFFVDGKPVTAHTFHNDNVHTTTYMTTAILPLRFEIENLSATGVSSTAKQICNTVISEGGYQGFSRIYNVDYSAKSISTTSYTPMISIRLNPARPDYPVIPARAAFTTTSANKVIQYRLIKNATLTSPTWTLHSNNNVQYDVSATAVSSGTVISSGYFQSGTPVNLSDINNFNFQLGRTISGTSDTLTVALISLDTAADVFSSLSWYELV
jgi:hypothetical protein